MPEPASPRPRCYRCMRPLRLCLCGGLPTVPTRTRIVVLQHPQEHRHPFGSARFVRLCLPNSELHVAYGGLTGDLLTPIDVPPDTAVLYPHPRATDLAALPAAARPGTLLVLDGTWAHAKRLHAMNPWLQRLRHVRFVPRVPSRYRIRREPHADCVSTIEATVEALHLLEPETPGLEALVAAFERMIDQQVEHTASVPRTGRSKRERQREARRLSPLLADPRLVVAYAESSLPGGDESAERQLVQWVAVQTGGGEVFEALLRPRGVWPTDCHLEHMGIRPGELAAGHDEAAARAAFLAWAGPGAPVATWTRSSLDWGRVLLPPGTPTLVLKTQYCNLRNRAASFLESVVAREGLATP
ncbi:MAG: DTW domain-containing protein, partial [Planctomycetes bacterium]|nr:DTW domain-containing protein [Planctomycetota bacterium]